MARKLTDRQLWFIWKTINELKCYLDNQIEAGAIGATKHSNDAHRAKELIQQQRVYNTLVLKKQTKFK